MTKYKNLLIHFPISSGFPPNMIFFIQIFILRHLIPIFFYFLSIKYLIKFKFVLSIEPHHQSSIYQLNFISNILPINFWIPASLNPINLFNSTVHFFNLTSSIVLGINLQFECFLHPRSLLIIKFHFKNFHPFL